ncbi:MAG: iron-containing alcohol dehydrogenase [Verrucomicrobiales bacterium]|nr:iron-containing alcohol dehydrogenase [Verrucomicrobiales bacterium]
MNTVTLLQPPRIGIGDGCVRQCVEVFAERGVARVLLVSTSPVLAELGGLLEVMQHAGMQVVRAQPVDTEPTIGTFESVLRTARAEKVGGVLAIGGGSALDVGKLVAALMLAAQDVRDVFGIELLRGRAVLLVCVPTTAGTGSEVSPNAILLDEQERIKKGVISRHLVPDAAFLDAELTRSVPPHVTAATGFDALTHCIEAYANRAAHPALDHLALEGIRLISAYLARAVRDGNDLEARGRLLLGSFYGGLCLGPVNTAAVHALAYPLGGRFGVAHGVSNAVLLPHVLRFNLPSAPERYAAIARALGVSPSATALATAERGLERIEALARECGIPQRLATLGVPREALHEMARAAMTVTRLLKNNPRPVTEADAVAIYEAAY